MGLTKFGEKVLTRSIRLLLCVAALFALVCVLYGCGNNGKTVDEYTWDELSEISEEIAAADDEESAIEIAKKYGLTTADGKLDGKQTKTVQLSDGESVEVQIAGFWHDEKTSGGKAGITFIFKEAISVHSMNSANTNAGGWESSEMREWLATEGINMLPSELSEKIIAVNKMSNNVGATRDVASVTPTSDRLWLFSVAELRTDLVQRNRPELIELINAEGTEYKLFSDTPNKALMIKTYNGEYCDWWQRTPSTYKIDANDSAPGATDFYCVEADADAYFCPASWVENRWGGGLSHLCAVPGFCI